MKSDDYIIITESHNLGEDSDDSGANFHKERDDSSILELEKQGIFIDKKNEETTSIESHEELSKELRELSGIEIIENNGEEDDYFGIA